MDLTVHSRRRTGANDFLAPRRGLYGISNTRLETRHAIATPAQLQLHPQLTQDERIDFVHDADLVVRTTVCLQLGLEPFVVGRRKGTK
jgi:hypothetical protein